MLYDFTGPGMGGRAAIARHTLAKIHEGHRFFAVADIANAHPSVRPEHLANFIPIPKWVQDNILFCDEGSAGQQSTAYATHDTTSMGCMHTTAPLGLSQGSPASTAAMSVVLGGMLRHLVGLVREISQIADDILASTHSRTEGEHFLSRLEADLLLLRPEGLRLKRRQVVDLGEGQPLDFVGYRFRLTAEGLVVVEPSPEAWRRARERCRGILLDQWANNPGLTRGALTDVADGYFFTGWAPAFPLWNASEEERGATLSDQMYDVVLAFFSQHNMREDATDHSGQPHHKSGSRSPVESSSSPSVELAAQPRNEPRRERRIRVPVIGTLVSNGAPPSRARARLTKKGPSR